MNPKREIRNSDAETSVAPQSADARSIWLMGALRGLGIDSPEVCDTLTENWVEEDRFNATCDRLQRKGILSETQRHKLTSERKAYTVEASAPTCEPNTNSLPATQAFQGPKPKPTQHLPTRFGPYEIIGPIASGGMGTVYKARHSKLRRLVALKVIRGDAVTTADQIRRFHREAKAAAKLNHPGVVALHELGKVGDKHYIAMAYVDGVDLAKHVRRGGAMAANDAAKFVAEAADAVAHAHAAGVIHRDIKPHNLLLDRSGKIQVADFGLAKLDEIDGELTSSGQVLGTPAYMAPEQALGTTQDVGKAADIYALGATFYFLLTGRPPFEAENVQGLLRKLLEEEATAPRKLNSTVPRDLETICLKAMSKVPTDRYATTLDLRDDLQRWLAGRPIHARRANLGERSWKWMKRNRGITAASLATLMLLATAAFFVLRSTDSVKVQRLENLIVTLESSPADAIEASVLELRDYPEESVVSRLRQRFEEAPEPSRRSLACGLAAYGDVRSDFIIQEVAQGKLLPQEMTGLIVALAKDKAASIEDLLSEASRLSSEALWSSKARLAIAALQLGDDRLASQMLRSSGTASHPGDPTQRTRLINELSRWGTHPIMLAEACKRVDDGDVRSGICLGLGGISNPSPDLVQAWEPLLQKWHLEASDSATHSATRWILERWALPIPEVATSLTPPKDRDWWEHPSGMTLLRVPVGELKPNQWSFSKVDSELWLCDREVTASQFRAFLADDRYEGPRPTLSPPDLVNRDGDESVRETSYYDAVMFCNWLSQQIGLDTCYRIERLPTEAEQYGIELLPERFGVRLPTVMEWEFACRAMTTTRYFSGHSKEDFAGYGRISTGYSQQSNSKMAYPKAREWRCNGWGFFDMLGGVQEICSDIDFNGLVHRVGSSTGIGLIGNAQLWTHHPIGMATDARELLTGFRIAIGATPDRPKSDMDAGDVPADLWKKLPVLVVQLADDDGGRLAEVSREQITEWVAFANKSFSTADIGLLEDSPEDFTVTVVKNSILNQIDPGRPDFLESLLMADRTARDLIERYGNHLVVFIRWGPGKEPAGPICGYCDWNFLILGKSMSDYGCKETMHSELAHQLGHMLGLAHTFQGGPRDTSPNVLAETLRGSDHPARFNFDGDGLLDTPQDPAIVETLCEHVYEVQLLGRTYPLPRRNLMSLYRERRDLSPQQLGRVRWGVGLRAKSMLKPRNDPEEPIEIGSDSVVDFKAIGDRQLSWTDQRFDPNGLSRWSGDCQLFVRTTWGESITISFEVPQAGDYELVGYFTLAPDFGKLRMSVDGTPTSATFDLFAPLPIPSGPKIIKRGYLGSGKHAITFKMSGKNEHSTGYFFGVDCLELRRSNNAN